MFKSYHRLIGGERLFADQSRIRGSILLDYSSIKKAVYLDE
jgi:hypothetical protein